MPLFLLQVALLNQHPCPPKVALLGFSIFCIHIDVSGLPPVDMYAKNRFSVNQERFLVLLSHHEKKGAIFYWLPRYFICFFYLQNFT